MSTAVRMPFLATCSAQQHQRMSTTYQHAFHACRAFNSNSQTAIQTGCKQAAQPHALEFLWETCYNTLFNTFNTSVNQWNQCGMIKQRRLCSWGCGGFSLLGMSWHGIPCLAISCRILRTTLDKCRKKNSKRLSFLCFSWVDQSSIICTLLSYRKKKHPSVTL